MGEVANDIINGLMCNCCGVWMTWSWYGQKPMRRMTILNLRICSIILLVARELVKAAHRAKMPIKSKKFKNTQKQACQNGVLSDYFEVVHMLV